MINPAFAVSPDKIKEDKAKKENLSPSPLPPTPWNLYIHVSDASDSTCLAALNCNLAFFWETAGSDDCLPISATPTGKVPFHFNQSDYTVSIPDGVTCVRVSIIDLTIGGCSYPINTNFCCSCKGGFGNPCRLKICP